MRKRLHFPLSFLAMSCLLLLNGCAHPGYHTPLEIAQTGTGKEPATLTALPATTLSSGAFNTSGNIASLAQKGVQVIQIGSSLRIILPTDQIFETDSLDIKHSEYETLNDVAAVLKKYGHSAIHITGYTDDIASKNAMPLTRAQARSVLTYLWIRGVPASRLFSDGQGSAHPVGNNKLPSGSAENRRIEITTKYNCIVECND